MEVYPKMRKALLKILYVGIIVMNLAMVGNSYSRIDPATLVGGWLLDEGSGNDAMDLSENGNDGDINGTKWVAGKFGGALEFSDASDFVKVPDAEGFDGISQLTLLAWFKFDSFPPQNYTTVGKEAVYRFVISPGGAGHFVLATIVNAWYSNGTLASGSGFKTGQWQHVAGTYDGNLVRLYIDSKLAGEGPQEISGDIVDSGSAFYINMVEVAAAHDTVDFYEGLIDEVAVFNVALPEEDIKDIMKSGLERALTGDTAVFAAGKLAVTWAATKETLFMR
jgi:concanavalin A-like lectin/glucanase superfamily protein